MFILASLTQFAYFLWTTKRGRGQDNTVRRFHSQANLYKPRLIYLTKTKELKLDVKLVYAVEKHHDTGHLQALCETDYFWNLKHKFYRKDGCKL